MTANSPDAAQITISPDDAQMAITLDHARTATALNGTWEAALAHLRAADPIMGQLIEQIGPCLLQQDREHFYSLLSSIVSQQISTRAAAAIMARVEAVFPPDEGPTATRVLAVGPEALRGAGLSGVKVRYVIDLAERVADGRLDLAHIATLDDEEVIAALTQVKGIGRWTAEMFLIFSLARPDVLPVGDLGFRAAVRRHYALAELPKEAESRQIGACWAPYRTIATWYLWRSLGSVPRQERVEQARTTLAVKARTETR